MEQELKIESEDLKMFDLYRRIVNANKDRGLKWDEQLGRAEGLATKCFFHATTALYLLRGTTISEANIHFYDASTINVTTRAALESLLVFAYLFELPKSEEEGEFNFYSWAISDLMIRQHVKPKNAKEENTLRDDKEKILEFTTKLKKNPYFLNLKTADQKRILKGDRRIEGWIKIGKSMGFDSRIIEWTYTYLCSYSHSGYLSILQLQTAIREGHKSPPLNAIVATIRIILANMIDLYCIKFPFAKEELYKDANDVSLIQKHLDATGHY